jgi:hypothetical protein
MRRCERILMLKVQPEAATAPSTPTEQRDDAELLAALTRECAQRGITLTLADNPGFDLATLVDDGRTLVVPPTDDLAEIVDDLRLIGHCCDCRSDLDDTALPYRDGHNHLDGSPIMICRACRDKRTRIASDPSSVAFDRALTAIEAAFKASKNPERTRNALRTFVDMTADEARTAARIEGHVDQIMAALVEAEPEATA